MRCLHRPVPMVALNICNAMRRGGCLKHARTIPMLMAAVLMAAGCALYNGDMSGGVYFDSGAGGERWSGSPHARGPEVVHFGEMLQTESWAPACLACHDGTIAKGVNYQLFKSSSMGSLGSHPTEVPYPAEWSGHTDFAPTTEITQAGLRLLDGKVTCTTCHNLSLPVKYYLPVTMTGSALCLACHRK